MLLQIQQSLSHLLDVKNLSPLGVANAFASRNFSLDVYEQARALTLAARIMRRAPSDDFTQLGLSVASAECMELDALLPGLVKSNALALAHTVTTFTHRPY